MRPSPDPSPRSPAPIIQPDAEPFRCILAHGLREHQAGQGPLTDVLGLSGAELAALRDRWLPGVDLATAYPASTVRPASAYGLNQQSIETLILWRAGVATPEARWLAAILARRSMESHHLWQDLGLPARPALSQMIARFLPGLARANTTNMRWKKFFARQICADAAFSLCPSPSCDACDERTACFSPD